ncbi:hypothetical protein ACOSQ3_019791 [Xanthoceras sorbifolium]
MTLLQGTIKDSLYQMQLIDTAYLSKQRLQSFVFHTASVSPVNTSSSACNSTLENNRPPQVSAYAVNIHSSLWHARLGHPAPLILNKIMQKLHVPCNIATLHCCDSYKMGKLHRLFFSRSSISAKGPLELVYIDLWGPAPIVSKEGYRYYIAFVDASTRYTWLFPLKLKSDAINVFILFQKRVELQLEVRIKCLQTDMGGEYLPFVPYLSQQ